MRRNLGVLPLAPDYRIRFAYGAAFIASLRKNSIRNIRPLPLLLGSAGLVGLAFRVGWLPGQLDVPVVLDQQEGIAIHAVDDAFAVGMKGVIFDLELLGLFHLRASNLLHQSSQWIGDFTASHRGGDPKMKCLHRAHRSPLCSDGCSKLTSAWANFSLAGRSAITRQR